MKKKPSQGNSATNNTTLVQIPFHGGEIEAVQTPDGRILVHFRRLCEGVGIDFQSQLAKLKGKRWSSVAMIATVAQDGKVRQLTMISLKAMTIWLTTIDPNKVRPEIKEKLEKYQDEAFDVIDAYFNGPHAENKALGDAMAKMRTWMEVAEKRLAASEKSGGELVLVVEHLGREIAKYQGQNEALEAEIVTLQQSNEELQQAHEELQEADAKKVYYVLAASARESGTRKRLSAVYDAFVRELDENAELRAENTDLKDEKRRMEYPSADPKDATHTLRRFCEERGVLNQYGDKPDGLELRSESYVCTRLSKQYGAATDWVGTGGPWRAPGTIAA